MKTHSRLLITVICMAALLFGDAAPAQEPRPSVAPRMKAIVYHNFGSPDILRLEEIEKPVPNDNQVLVRVRAASVNPLDWHYMEGTPYIIRLLGIGLFKPKEKRLGVDYAGTVEAVGKNPAAAGQFKPGDEVFGGRTGAYVCVLADRAIVLKPANLTFEEAASVPIAGITALQGLRDKGKIQPGQKVLINGASGGVGTFAVQIAKSFDADVTGVCSTRNVDLVRSIGADRIIDYTKEDFTKSGERYDVIFDTVGNHSLLECRRALKPMGKYIGIGGGGPNEQGWIGSLANPIRALVLSPFVSQAMGTMLAELNQKDLSILADLMQAGKVTPVIDRTYTLSQVPEAIRYLEQGHARGKVVITLAQDNETVLVGANRAARSVNTTGSVLIASALIAIVIGVTVVPIVVALILNRRFQRGNPEKRPFRWGYYFSILAFIGGLALGGIILDSGVSAVIVCGIIYAVLAWFFAQRHHWAWITLTILSFNPAAWIINSIYLRKRWAEDSVAAPTMP
jgi:NADPH:quinone reductase-like Zn-dependent oxidoreductase